MPQDVTFDLPSRPPSADIWSTPRSAIRAGSGTWSRSAAGPGFDEYKSRDLPQTALTCPHASADDMVVLTNWLPLIAHTGRPALDPPAFLERQRTSDRVVAPRLTGRECFLINTAEAARQVPALH